MMNNYKVKTQEQEYILYKENIGNSFSELIFKIPIVEIGDNIDEDYDILIDIIDVEISQNNIIITKVLRFNKKDKFYYKEYIIDIDNNEEEQILLNLLDEIDNIKEYKDVGLEYSNYTNYNYKNFLIFKQSIINLVFIKLKNKNPNLFNLINDLYENSKTNITNSNNRINFILNSLIIYKNDELIYNILQNDEIKTYYKYKLNRKLKINVIERIDLNNEDLINAFKVINKSEEYMVLYHFEYMVDKNLLTQKDINFLIDMINNSGQIKKLDVFFSTFLTIKNKDQNIDITNLMEEFILYYYLNNIETIHKIELEPFYFKQFAIKKDLL